MATTKTSKTATKAPAKKTTSKATTKEVSAPAKATKTTVKDAKAPAKKTATKTTKTATKAPAKKTVKQEIINPIQSILDPKNNQNVILFNENDEAVEFEQVALIPYEKNLYAILKPVELIDGIESDEAVVFLLVEEDNDIYLDVIDDDDTVDAIFEIYNKLFEEATQGTK